MFVSVIAFFLITNSIVNGFKCATPQTGLTKLFMTKEKPETNNEPLQSLIPPKYEKKLPLKIKWLPFGNFNAPALLDGTFAGDVGFDPLHLSRSKEGLYWMREAEIKHARLAMLGAVGWPLSELWHKNIADTLHMDSILASGDRAPSILNGGLSSTYASGMLMVTIILGSIIESKALETGEVFWFSKKPDDYIPGDYQFDPLKLESRIGRGKHMQTAEIKNGRLAMLAVTSYVFQEFLTGQPVIQQTPYLF